MNPFVSSGLQFAEPKWLWALVAVPVIYLLLVLEQRRRTRRFESFASREVWKQIAPAMVPGARLRKARLWLLAISLLIIALARPQMGYHEETARVSGLDIFFVLDVSNSMEVEDVVPNRLKKAKHLIRTMVQSLRGDRVGLVSFAASAGVTCPLTTDLDYFLDAVDMATPRTVLNQGTDFEVGLETALRAIDRGAEESADKAKQEASSRILILISDGENQEQEPLEVARRIADEGIKFYVLGVGTEKGGPIPSRDENGTLRGFKRPVGGGDPVISRFSPNALMQITSVAKGKYWTVTPDESETHELLKDMGSLDRGSYMERKYLVYEERFQFPLALGVLLLLIEMAVPTRRREETVTGGGSTSMLSVLLALGVFWELVGGSAKALAAPLDVYLENRKGLQEFKEGKIDEAKKSFGSAQALNPQLPEPGFNQGVSEFLQGAVDPAIRSFDQAARNSREQKNPSVEAKSYYNLGAVLEKKGDANRAIRSYLESIRGAQAAGDKSLESEARKKIELIAKNLQKQRQEQQQQKQQQEQKKQDQQQQQGQQQQGQQQQKQDKPQDKPQDPKDGSGEQKKGDQANPEEKNLDGKQHLQDRPIVQPKDRFESDKMTKDDAERVMAEIANRERELQSRMGSRGARSQTHERDW